MKDKTNKLIFSGLVLVSCIIGIKLSYELGKFLYCCAIPTLHSCTNPNIFSVIVNFLIGIVVIGFGLAVIYLIISGISKWVKWLKK